MIPLQGLSDLQASQQRITLLSLAFILCCTLLALNNIGFQLELANVREEESGLIKPHHMASAATFLLLIYINKIFFPNILITAFFFLSFITSIVAFSFYGLNLQIVTLVYCFALAVIGTSIFRIKGYDETLRLCRIAFLLALTLVMIKNIFFLPEIMSAILAGSRVWIPGLVAGGVNPEGVTLALGIALFFNSRLLLPYFVTVTALNFVYSSRGGILVCALAGAIWLMMYISPRRVLLAAGALAAALMVAALAPADSVVGEAISKVVSRFSEIGTDPGSLGRIDLWTGIPQALSENIFGYGVMNAVPVLERLMSTDIVDVHLHNIYMQALMDVGIQGLVAYLLIVIFIIISAFRNRANNLFAILMILYFFSGALRFRLFDTIIYIFMGIAISRAVELASAKRREKAASNTAAVLAG